ncbi:hypothetical protein IH981_03200 [Patescibacteria group bacterium]|nr:hypothetical protein [Patescibacteria group bacterium]
MKYESNPCIRCGKERIKDREKIIVVNSMKAKLTVFVCPDKDCQKIVEEKIAAKEERRLAFAAKRTLHLSKKKSS